MATKRVVNEMLEDSGGRPQHIQDLGGLVSLQEANRCMYLKIELTGSQWERQTVVQK